MIIDKKFFPANPNTELVFFFPSNHPLIYSLSSQYQLPSSHSLHTAPPSMASHSPLRRGRLPGRSSHCRTRCSLSPEARQGSPVRKMGTRVWQQIQGQSPLHLLGELHEGQVAQLYVLGAQAQPMLSFWLMIQSLGASKGLDQLTLLIFLWSPCPSILSPNSSARLPEIQLMFGYGSLSLFALSAWWSLSADSSD